MLLVLFSLKLAYPEVEGQTTIPFTILNTNYQSVSHSSPTEASATVDHPSLLPRSSPRPMLVRNWRKLRKRLRRLMIL